MVLLMENDRSSKNDNEEEVVEDEEDQDARILSEAISRLGSALFK